MELDVTGRGCTEWDGAGRDGAVQNGTELDGTGLYRMGRGCTEWDGAGRDGAVQNGTELDGTGLYRMGRGCTEWDGAGRDGAVQNGTELDGTGLYRMGRGCTEWDGAGRDGAVQNGTELDGTGLYRMGRGCTEWDGAGRDGAVQNGTELDGTGLYRMGRGCTEWDGAGRDGAAAAAAALCRRDGAVADYRDRGPGGGCAPRDSGSCRVSADPAPLPAQDPRTPRNQRAGIVPIGRRCRRREGETRCCGARDCGCLEAFGQGESLLQDPACVEELEDRLHFYVEECDYLQGFQVLCDLHNGFSGVGAKVTELLHDEYSRKGILTWGLTPVLSAVGDPQTSFYRLMNTALGIAHLSRHSSLFCPMSLSGSLGIKPQPPVTFPYIKYEASLNYHSSAILAAALDTLTVPYRLCSSQGSMMHFADSLTFSGRKVVAAWAALPFPALAGSWLPDILSAQQQEMPWKLLSSWREQKGSCCFAQSVVLRGICQEKPSSSCLGQPQSPLHSCGSSEQVLQQFLHTHFPGAFSTSHVLQQPCDTQPPFPQFFSPLLSRRGFLLDKAQAFSSAGVESIPVLAALQSCPGLHSLLSGLCQQLQAPPARRWSSSCRAGLEQDDFQEALEELRTLAQCYETDFGADGAEDEADSD
ncbi:PREDICTED: protein misato homolog 1 isoform X2 [Ficedula albicollis]|uniref:protein misato homolog 1 isoform X2 n=1 Tax=Ficedula albicollis TaxID=59894 RepID=UPI0007AD933A|nr:PREDICTED: protein misato homolog 1 isoform X2 [Ficedula albicollis]